MSQTILNSTQCPVYLQDLQCLKKDHSSSVAACNAVSKMSKLIDSCGDRAACCVRATAVLQLLALLCREM